MKGLEQYPALLVVVLVLWNFQTVRLSNRFEDEWRESNEDEIIFRPGNKNMQMSQGLEWNETIQDDALQDCKNLINSQPEIKPFNDMRYFTGEEGEKLVESWTVQSGYPVYHVVRLHAIGAVKEDPEWTLLCVGMYDATAYTYSDKASAGGRPIAWITTHTRSEHAIGYIKLETRCWRALKQFPDCNAVYYPTTFMENLPQFSRTPITEQFWHNFTYTDMGISFFWIWKINVNLNKTIYDINVQPEWIYKLDIPSLYELEITGNTWGSPEKLLRPLNSLRYLDLRNNKLQKIPEGMFNNVPELVRLNIGYNNLTRFPTEITNLQNLKWLDLSYMTSKTPFAISDDDVKNISKLLNILKLENTLLTANLSSFFSLPNLKFLNLSGCLIGQENEKIVHVPSTCNIKYLDLASNNISKLPFSEMPGLDTLVLRDNAFMMWDQSVLVDYNLTNLYLTNNLISNLTENSFSTLNNLQNLSLSGNRIRYITSYVFRHNLQIRLLDLSDNLIEFISEYSFWNLSSLEKIYLSNNRLKDVPYFFNEKLIFLDLSFNALTEFKQNNSCITYVDLSYNNIVYLDIVAIQTLNLSYNNLKVISAPMWSSISEVGEVDLGGNIFECCLFGNNSFGTQNMINLGMHSPITCSINETSPQILIETFVYNESECNAANYFASTIGVEVVIPLVVIAVSIILVATLIYVYRFDLTYVKYLIKLKKLGTKNDENRYETCDYDAFVCYSAKNFSWVHDRLLPALERPPFCYRLCVHDRDFVLGAAINENIVASLAKSRKVILVLSKDFIASKWCQWELEMASHKMFVEKRSSIILLELERLEKRYLPWHLQYLMARITYLQWPSEGDAGDEEAGEECEADSGAEAESGAHAVALRIYPDNCPQKERENARGRSCSAGEATDSCRRQRRLRREETCLKRLREALGESLCQRRGSLANRPPRSVLDSP